MYMAAGVFLLVVDTDLHGQGAQDRNRSRRPGLAEHRKGGFSRDEHEMYDLIVSRRTVRQFQPESRPAPGPGTYRRGRAAGAFGGQPAAARVHPGRTRTPFAAEVFPCLKWAAYIAPAGNPAPGRSRPPTSIVLVNTAVREKGYEYDVGAAMENMILAGLTEGVASCWLLSVDRDRLREILDGAR